MPTPLLQLQGARLLRGDRLIFDSLSLSLASGEIVALCGSNGSGKSSLLAVLAGDLTLSSGHYATEELPAWLRQEARPAPIPVHRRLLRFEPAIYDLALRLDSGRWEELDAYQAGGGYELERRAAEVAARCGLEPLLDRDTSSLSPGQLQKVDLAALFACRSRVLLLDEPTNYLDLEGLAQLEAELERHRDLGGSALVVSHDRALLDAVVDRSLHLELSTPAGHGDAERHAVGFTQSRGGYSRILGLRQERHRAAADRARTLSRKIRQLEQVARSRARWAERKEASKRGAGASKPFIAKRAKKMMKRAKDADRRRKEQMVELERERPFVEKNLGVAAPSHPVARRRVVAASSLRLPWGTPEPMDLLLETSDRSGLLGDNGAGKTTLARVLNGDLRPVGGAVEINPHVPTEWMRQGLEDFFDDEPLLDQLVQRSPDHDESESEIRTQLGCLGLRAARALARPRELSVGERVRAALVQITLARCDFVFLDEPTTHLDLESIEFLEGWLRESTSGFLLVSHDRRLLERTCDRLLHLSADGLREL